MTAQKTIEMAKPSNRKKQKTAQHFVEISNDQVAGWIKDAIQGKRLQMPSEANIKRFTNFLNLLMRHGYPGPEIDDPMRDVWKPAADFKREALRALKRFEKLLLEKQVDEEVVHFNEQRKRLADALTTINQTIDKMYRPGQKDSWHLTARYISDVAKSMWATSDSKRSVKGLKGKTENSPVVLITEKSLKALGMEDMTAVSVAAALQGRRGKTKPEIG